MGCAVACVAYISGTQYDDAWQFFDSQSSAYNSGYYCPDIVQALKRAGLSSYKYKEIKKDITLLEKKNSIVFCNYCPQYPSGHYLAKSDSGWMNPWINYPRIDPAESGIIKDLPSRPTWIIYNI